MARTKEERFILQLYKEALKCNNIYEPLDCYEIGESIGYSERLVKNTVKILAQINFIRKKGASEISITDLGIELVNSL